MRLVQSPHSLSTPICSPSTSPILDFHTSNVCHPISLHILNYTHFLTPHRQTPPPIFFSYFHLSPQTFSFHNNASWSFIFLTGTDSVLLWQSGDFNHSKADFMGLFPRYSDYSCHESNLSRSSPHFQASSIPTYFHPTIHMHSLL